MSIDSALKKFLLEKKNSLLENIMLCLAITLTSAFFWYDNYYFFMDFLRAVVSVLVVVSWLWCGFLSGRDRKWGFLVFAGAYWLVPYLYMLYFSSRDNIADYNAFITMLYEFADLLYDKPLRTIADFTNCGVYIWILSLIILTFTTYFVGVNVADIYRDKERSANADDKSDESDDSEEFYEDEGYSRDED